MSISPRYRIALFLLLTYALSAPFYSRGPVAVLMWCPGTAAMILRLVTQRNLRGMGWPAGPLRWNVLSYVAPPAIGLVVYSIVWLTGIGGFSPAGITLGQRHGTPFPLPLSILFLATVGFAMSALFALGEEIGWRGYLVPELARISSFGSTSLISGAAWSIYHYPLILFSDYNSGAPKWFALLIFTWMVMVASVIYVWLRLKSGSLWPAVILHASHNLFIQQIFDRLTEPRPYTKYVTTEFGVGLAIVYTVVALYCWSRRGEVAAAVGPAA